MRPVKFRLWDSINDKIIYPNDEKEYFINANGTLCWPYNNDIYSMGIENNLSFDTTHALMQFTGLKDMYEIEVYEGDLLRASNHLYEIQSCVGGFCCQVWDELKTGEIRKGSVYIFSCLSGVPFKVIGNIYEHSNLLESAK